MCLSEEEMGKAGKVIVVIVIGFALFFIISDPAASGANVMKYLGWIGESIKAVYSFFTSMH